MKLTIAGVTSSAAHMRSPSFSRSSSSATMTNLPAAISRSASSIGVKVIERFDVAEPSWPIRGHEALHMFSDHIGFDVDLVAVPDGLECRVSQRIVDERKLNDIRTR